MVRQDKIDILVDTGLHVVGGRLGVFARKPAPVQATWLGYPGTTGLDTMDYRFTDPQLDPPDCKESQIRASEMPFRGGANPKSEIRTNDPNPNVPISNNLQGLQDLPEPLSHLNIGALGVDSDFGFRISDFSTKEPYYSERSIRLPDCFWCYDPHGMEEVEGGDQVAPGPLPALNSNHVTFGCLNNFCKVTAPTLELWAKVMGILSDSRLILLAPPGEHRKGILQKLRVTEDRVEFVGRQERQPYLETYKRIDICLDTIPYNGHTTTLDALWMGVPVVTRTGRTVVGRAGWSHLHNLGLEELVAQSDEEFVNKAVELGKDVKKLENLHATLRQRMEQSPLMDGRTFAKNMESAYRQMWRAWCIRQH
jgi:protein O-GlcNAc transferase